MILDCIKHKTVNIKTHKDIKSMLNGVPHDTNGKSQTLAANNLFQINKTDLSLDEFTAMLFYHNVAKLFFLCKQTRPDLQTAMAFLCTQVNSLDKDDYNKLSCIIKCLCGTPNFPLRLKANNSQSEQWYMNASYGVHVNMKNHTVATVTMGKGAVHLTSIRQKLITKISTEGVLVRVNDAMPQTLWTWYFL